MQHYPVILERFLDGVNGVKTRKQLAGEYDMSDSTFYRLLKKHGVQPPKGLIKPADYIRVYQVLGRPCCPRQLSNLPTSFMRILPDDKSVDRF